jgi:hypothetical protein
MRKILILATTALLIFGFSNVALSSSVLGDWDVDGKLSIKIKVDGGSSEKDKSYIYDWLTFYSNGYFDTYDFDGIWQETEKGKFFVEMYHETIELFFEDMFWEAAEIDVNVQVEEATFSGKLKKGKDGDIIKGKYKIKVSFSNPLNDLYGSIKMQCKFVGTRFYLDADTAADQGTSLQFEDTMIDLIQEALNKSALLK